MATTPNAGDGEADILAAKAWDEALQEQLDEAPRAGGISRNPSAVFNEFSSSASSGGVSNDIDFILDIPVQLKVELGRTKISIKNQKCWSLSEAEIKNIKNDLEEKKNTQKRLEIRLRRG